jgi:hypothetical protein
VFCELRNEISNFKKEGNFLTKRHATVEYVRYLVTSQAVNM